MLQVRLPESTSVACKVSSNSVGSLSSDMLMVVLAPSVITGASFAAEILIVTVAALLSSSPSLTLKVKLSDP